MRRKPDDPVDLETQLEELFDTVWRCERYWRLDDLIDLRTGAVPIVRRLDHGRWDDGFRPPRI